MADLTSARTAALTRRVRFSSLHALGNPDLSDEENRKIFGKCFRTHGHDYHLEVTVRGEIDSRSGLCCDRDQFEDILENEVVAKFDGKDLNKIFRDTSGESLAREFYSLLKKFIPQLSHVRLQETPKNFFICTGETTAAHASGAKAAPSGSAIFNL